MISPALFLILMAEALLIIIVLDYGFRITLPPALAYIFKRLAGDLIRSPDFVAGITSKLLGARVNQLNSKKPFNKTEQIATGNGAKLNKELNTSRYVGKQVQTSLKINSGHPRVQGSLWCLCNS
ncbi:hypothetical protein BN14_06136 [Rhizoctonia solani AG-1 IB]|uniref:Uncharacterized protein n=2 Tax=Rhizoctonia solani TaxID=456999 RepID=A0A8H3GDG8_9AGAM|nr:unnamed protein product [Rhizoctonia solani]CCO32083.1 hypothetical protein BN14_06136 [Rhizoctonia solani AG-1 IB]